jgi:hypothetical protein
MSPLASLPPAVDLPLAVQAAFLGRLWGLALVVWGVCATLVAVAALRRRPSTADRGLGRLHAQIRRSCLAGSSPVATAAPAVRADAAAHDPRAQEQAPAALAVKQAVA